MQMLFVKAPETDYSALCSKLEASVKEGMDEEKRRVCEDCSFVITSHQRCKSRILSRLLRFSQENESKHADFLQPVVIGNEGVPRLRATSWKESLF